MKQVSALLVLGLAVVGCGFGPASVAFTFDNRTDAVLCAYPSSEDAAGGRCLSEIKPQGKGHGGRDCDNQEDRPVHVVIVVKSDRRVIYDRTATCGEWEHHGTFVIERAGSVFVVTDELELR